MTQRGCSVEDCDRSHYAKGMCHLHWQRQKKGQPFEAPLRGSIEECSIEGCGKGGKITRGLCRTHYTRWFARQRYGRPETRDNDLAIKLPGGHGVGEVAGPEHYRWLGDEIGYKGAHIRVKRARGSASRYLCGHCMQPAQEWAYNHTDPNPSIGEYGGSLMEYSLDANCYIPLCRPCHRVEDARYRKTR